MIHIMELIIIQYIIYNTIYIYIYIYIYIHLYIRFLKGKTIVDL